MRRILDEGADRMVVPLVLLAYVSALFRDLSIEGLRVALKSSTPGPLTAILAFLLICIPLAALLLFYGLSWVVAQIGRLFDGVGTTREMRSALAWGLAPIIWALLYRIPASFTHPATTPGRSLELSRLFQRGGVSALFAFTEILLIVWYLIVASATIGEAHRFSTLRGFATLLSVFTIPFILAVAFVLTSHT
jgi:hypothetical protein